MMMMMFRGRAVLGTVQVQVVEQLALVATAVVRLQPLALLGLGDEGAILEALPRVEVADAGMAYLQGQPILGRDLKRN